MISWADYPCRVGDLLFLVESTDILPQLSALNCIVFQENLSGSNLPLLEFLLWMSGYGLATLDFVKLNSIQIINQFQFLTRH
jgi:hypothetical protein